MVGQHFSVDPGASLGLDPAGLAGLPAAAERVLEAAPHVPGALADLRERATVHREVLARHLGVAASPTERGPA